jgi:hypothetical protein
MGIVSKMVEKASKEGKLNEGQYNLKPWLANLIMGVLEIVLVIGWLIGGVLSGMSLIMDLDFDLIDDWDEGTSFVLAGIYLVWNLLVWLIKPLRTRFNYKCSIWNVVFIIWLIACAITTMMS